jgi:hypothetical protein
MKSPWNDQLWLSPRRAVWLKRCCLRRRLLSPAGACHGERGETTKIVLLIGIRMEHDGTWWNKWWWTNGFRGIFKETQMMLIMKSDGNHQNSIPILKSTDFDSPCNWRVPNSWACPQIIQVMRPFLVLKPMVTWGYPYVRKPVNEGNHQKLVWTCLNQWIMDVSISMDGDLSMDFPRV